jgi:hypothetical protein
MITSEYSCIHTWTICLYIVIQLRIIKNTSRKYLHSYANTNSIFAKTSANFSQTGIDCLRHRIDDKGLHADADKMAKIREWNMPHNFNDVQRFLGLVQYLARFLPDVMAFTSPLASITVNRMPFSWRPLYEKCFQTIKVICC